MKLLVTGFEPFGGEKLNPSWLAVEALPQRIGPWEIKKLRVPTVFGRAARLAIQAAEAWEADAVLAVGMAKGRVSVSLEAAALNLRFARIPDNDGQSPKDTPIDETGPAAYFASVPYRRMAQAVLDAGIPAEVSFSAGVYVCNDLFYSLLRHFADTPVRVGFLHVPQLPRQGEPSLPLDRTVSALAAAICAL
ncbi:MAG: pyroglutamyl-peptidase I [Clostridia bacterium]|nr:pyroglutamyl-peptidase I [Clostridia bacterium]